MVLSMIKKNPACGDVFGAPDAPLFNAVDHRRGPHYSFRQPMSTKKSKKNDQFDLEQLIQQLEELIALCERLQDENIRLRAKHVQLQSSHSRLADKNELSRRKLETMITRLKTLEAEL